MSKDSLIITAVLFLVSILVLGDIALDLIGGSSTQHIIVEGFVLFLSLAGLYLLTSEYFQIKKANVELKRNLEMTRQDMLSWKKDAEKYLHGLGQAIDKQMTKWGFTPAEKEVGLLILKGFSFKEIANIRATSERTTRQQSLEVYRKSGLSGRAEFSAFFLEDLLLPGPAGQEG
ncbi:MAG: hypothetical protein OEY50_11670 [Nitrospinota bacterium]|nr:hypothetical protein [Nitrospinota bacterium]MDH5678619.1 hypothetical protein [Nitrospinota bacterium]